jgi:hypothetical protein
LISHVNTVKAPNPTALLNEEISLGYLPSGSPVSDATNTSFVSAANQSTAWSLVGSFDPATAETDSTPSTAPISGIKGDPTGDAAAVISNVVNSTGTAAAGITAASANNPADGLFGLGFLVPGLLDYTRTADGDPITPVTLSSAALAEQATVNANYGTFFTTDGSAGANANTTGGSTFYGGTGSSNGVAINGNIPITAKDVSSSGGILTVTNANASNGDANRRRRQLSLRQLQPERRARLFRRSRSRQRRHFVVRRRRSRRRQEQHVHSRRRSRQHHPNNSFGHPRRRHPRLASNRHQHQG